MANSTLFLEHIKPQIESFLATIVRGTTPERIEARNDKVLASDHNKDGVVKGREEVVDFLRATNSSIFSNRELNNALARSCDAAHMGDSEMQKALQPNTASLNRHNELMKRIAAHPNAVNDRTALALSELMMREPLEKMLEDPQLNSLLTEKDKQDMNRSIVEASAQNFQRYAQIMRDNPAIAAKSKALPVLDKDEDISFPVMCEAITGKKGRGI